jgi:hypothetical protein
MRRDGRGGAGMGMVGERGLVRIRMVMRRWWVGVVLDGLEREGEKGLLLLKRGDVGWGCGGFGVLLFLI